MTIEVTMYDSSTLLGVMQQMEPVSSYWLDTFFQSQVTSEDEYIDFEKITNVRKLAPFVSPSAQGRPIYSEGSTVTRLKPAYVKPKDAVSAARQIKRRPGELTALNPQSPAQRYNAHVAAIMRDHREAIERRWEWMAAQAIITGKVVIAGEDYPECEVDFGRASNHTVSLGATKWWGENGVSIVSDIEMFRSRVRKAKFGGATNRLTVGGDVWDVMRKDSELIKLLDTQMRGTDANFRTGIRDGAEVEYVGRISGTLDVYVYSDYYEANGSEVPFMSSKDIVLTGPNVNGVRAFGAILDKKAGMRALPIFPKMWDQEDPSVTFVMSQSAPLMIPVNPNNTLKATVLS